MFFFGKVPFIRLLLPFAAGILLSEYSALSFSFLLSVLSVTVVLYSVLLFRKKINLYSIRWLPGMLAMLAMFLSGWILCTLKSEKDHPEHFSRYGKAEYFIASLYNEPREGARTFKVPAEITGIRSDGKLINSCGNIMLYFSKDDFPHLTYGDNIVFKSKISEVQPPLNPGEFDYKRYLSYKRIYHSAFLSGQNFAVLKTEKQHSLLRYASEARNYLLGILSSKLSGDELSVSSALLLGYDDTIDRDLLNSYSGTGVIHILSVSGFHVMIIYFVFNTLLQFLERYKAGRLIKISVLLLLIFAYTFITGFSPPAARASLMISVLIIGKVLKLHHNSWNTLGFSAFLLLLYDPFLIFDIGFRFSFLAVAGLIGVFPPLYSLWVPSGWLADKIWAMICVSLAAQVTTLPLSIFYFNSFPVYFLPANLLVVPFSIIILYTGIGLFALSWYEPLALLAGKLLSGLTYCLNYLIRFIDKLPFSAIENITLTAWQCALLYAFLVFTAYYFISRNTRMLHAGLGLLLAVLLIECSELYINLNQKKLIIYRTPGNTCLQFTNGRKSLLLAFNGRLDKQKFQYSVKPAFTALNIKRYTEIHYSDSVHVRMPFVSVGDGLACFYNRKLALACRQEQVELQPEAEYLFIYGNGVKDISRVKSYRMILFDASIPFRQLKKLKKQAESTGLNYYSIGESGAFSEDLLKMIRPLKD